MRDTERFFKGVGGRETLGGVKNCVVCCKNIFEVHLCGKREKREKRTKLGVIERDDF